MKLWKPQNFEKALKFYLDKGCDIKEAVMLAVDNYPKLYDRCRDELSVSIQETLKKIEKLIRPIFEAES